MLRKEIIECKVLHCGRLIVKKLRRVKEKKMAEVMDEGTTHWWWLDSHVKASERSPWLQSTLSELDQKTKAMLELIEENADSFAQRAEMYYKKRPELINMVEEFYRAHRSLAERYDLVKTDHGTRLVTTFGSPFMSIKYHKPEKLVSMANQTYNSYSESSDADEYAKSEVEDPEQEGEIQIENEFEEVEDPELLNEIHQVDEELKEAQVVENAKQEDEIQVAQESKEDCAVSDVYIDEIKTLREELETLKEENKKQKFQLEFAEETLKVFVLSEVYIGEIEKLKEEIETLKEENQKRKVQLEVTEESKKDSVLRDVYVSEIEKLWVEIETLKEENKIQKDQLQQKDQEKIQVIRQLSMAVGVLKDENSRLRKHIAREAHKKNISFDLNKVKDSFFGKLFRGSSNSPSTVLPLERL